MPSIKITFDKDTPDKNLKTKSPVITEEMSEQVTRICEFLISDSSCFNEDDAGKGFDMILLYIKKYHRILYSQISNMIYALYEKHPPEEAMITLGTMISNIEKIMEYTGTQQYRDKLAKIECREERDFYKDTQNALIKIWDHVNLAQAQYCGLKQTDEEYNRKFDASIEPFKNALVRDMNAQLLTMVSIFTALAFLIFGGISSLGSIFSNHELPVLKIMIIGCVWGLCILNLLFVFLFCVGKMTNLNFRSCIEANGSIFQKYPVVWWSNLVVLTLLAGNFWTYYIRQENIDSWFRVWCGRFPQVAMWGGYGILAVAFIVVSFLLFRHTRKSGD